MRVPLTTPTSQDKLFAALRRETPKPKAREARRNYWIPEAMWRIIDERVSARWYPAQYQAIIRRLGCAINEILKEDCQQRTKYVEGKIEALLGADPPPPHPQGILEPD